MPADPTAVCGSLLSAAVGAAAIRAQGRQVVRMIGAEAGRAAAGSGGQKNRRPNFMSAESPKRAKVR